MDPIQNRTRRRPPALQLNVAAPGAGADATAPRAALLSPDSPPPLQLALPGSRRRPPGLGLTVAMDVASPRSGAFSLSKVQQACPGASLYHGSTSASLLTFLREHPTRGQLMTAGQMLGQGLVPMSGELGNSLHPRAPAALSTCRLSHFDGAHDYAATQGRREALQERVALAQMVVDIGQTATVDGGADPDADFQAAQRLLQTARRQDSARAALPAPVQDLVAREFPVVYALDRGLEAVARRGGSDVPGEVRVPSPVEAASIRGAFVPAAEVARVSALLEHSGHGHIEVVALESLHA